MVKDSLLLFVKGLLMGVADVIPGISGGTIALITGIYSHLIHSLSQLSGFFVLLIAGKFRPALKKVDFAFFVPLGFGLAISILLFSRMITFLLEEHTALTFSFFFGLIFASTIFITKKIGQFKFGYSLFIAFGLIISYFISGAEIIQASHNLITTFFSGMLAISAMLLPGISGSFILLLFNQYDYILNTLNSLSLFDPLGSLPALLILSVFCLGILLGLLFFSKVLNFILRYYKKLTFSFLVGLMLGSLRIPYKNIVSSDYNLILVLVAFFVGFALVFLLEGMFKEEKLHLDKN